MEAQNEPTAEEVAEKLFKIHIQHKLGIEKIAVADYDTLLGMHPVDAMKQIDLVFNAMLSHTKYYRSMTKAKKKRPARLYVWAAMWHDLYIEYGRWSHIFNKAIRENIKTFSEGWEENETIEELHAKYKYVYAYWWNRQHYIVNIMKKHSGIWGQKATKNLEKARKTLAGLIKGEIQITELSEKFVAIIDALDSQGERGGHDQEFSE